MWCGSGRRTSPHSRLVPQSADPHLRRLSISGDSFYHVIRWNVKNTMLAWERKFVALHQVLLLYAVVHEFLESVIEGDEAYTKVQKHVPPDQSRGWTILLMDRASRFIWALDL